MAGQKVLFGEVPEKGGKSAVRGDESASRYHGSQRQKIRFLNPKKINHLQKPLGGMKGRLRLLSGRPAMRSPAD
jgi:hypothetical protein